MPFKDKAVYNQYMAEYMRKYRQTHKETLRIQRKEQARKRYEKALAVYHQGLADRNLKSSPVTVEKC